MSPLSAVAHAYSPSAAISARQEPRKLFEPVELPGALALRATPLQETVKGDFTESSGSKSTAPSTVSPMIARSVALTIVVKDFTTSRASLDSLLARHHGYVAQLTTNTPENASRTLQASLRIPASELESALAELKSLGRTENEFQSGEEVTQQHADLLARLKNARETEQRFQAILLQRTGKIEDVLEVEREIARVRGEIETMQANQRNLEHRVDFASVDLQLNEEYHAQINVPTTPSVANQIHNALVLGYRHARDTIMAILLFAAEDGPVLIILFALFGVPAIFVIRRRRHAHTRTLKSQDVQ